MKLLKDDSGKAAVWVFLALAVALGAAVHIFIIKPARLASMESETATSLDVMRNALGKYYSQKGNYPDSLDALIPTYISKIANANPHPLGRSSRVQYVSSAAELDLAGGWAFDTNPQSETYGRLFVNAPGKDSEGKSWTGY